MQKSISEWTTHWFEADGQPQQKTTPGKNWTTENEKNAVWSNES